MKNSKIFLKTDDGTLVLFDFQKIDILILNKEQNILIICYEGMEYTFSVKESFDKLDKCLKNEIYNFKCEEKEDNK